VQQPPQLGDQPVHVPGLDEAGVHIVAGDLGHASDPEADRRQAAGRRFAERLTECLFERGPQEDVARAFATKAPVAEKWEGIEWRERAGVPVLGGAVLWVACELQDVIAGGDHVIVTGEVAELEAPGGEPLLFHGGGYRPLGSA